MPINEKIQCPYCGGTEEISKPKLSTRAMALGVLLLGFPFLFMSKVYHCFDCAKDFKKGDTKDVGSFEN